MDVKEPNMDEVSKEQLLIYLKERNKEIKISERKMKKLEERYLTSFKEIKTLKKNIEAFYKSFENICAAEKVGIPKDENDRLNFFEAFTSELASRLNQKLTHYKDNEDEFKLAIENVKAASSSQFSSEIAKLKQQLFSKDDQIQALQEKISEQDNAHFDSLLNDLKSISVKKETKVEDQIKESDKTSEIIRLRQELSKFRDGPPARIALTRHQSMKETHENGAGQKPLLLEHASQTDESDLMEKTSNGSNDKKHHEFRRSHTSVPNSFQEINDSQIKVEEMKVKSYIKDLLNKFFTYEAQGLEKEKLLIMNVIFDVLLFNYEEKVKIEKVLTKKGRFLTFF